MILEYLADFMIYIYIAILFIAVVILFLWISSIRRKRYKVLPLDNTYLNNLYEALGKKENIVTLDIVQKRIQIEVRKVDDIDKSLLKSLGTPAFVTGTKITLLIKDNANEVFKYLNEKRKEEA